MSDGRRWCGLLFRVVGKVLIPAAAPAAAAAAVKDYAKVDEESFEVISNTGRELSPITCTYVKYKYIVSYTMM